MYTLVGIVLLSLSRCAFGNSTSDVVGKSILRYGFQYTQSCDDFAKAFICIQKCQDLNFDSAVCDKQCRCTCYMKPELQKHKIKSNTTRDDWKSGAPTTKLPIWAQTTNTDVTDDENVTEFGDDDTNTDDTPEETSSTDDNTTSDDTVTIDNNSTENTTNSNDTDHTTHNGTEDETSTHNVTSNDTESITTNASSKDS